MSDKSFTFYSGKLFAIHPSAYIEDDLEYFELTPEEFAERCDIDIDTLRLLLDCKIPMTREIGEKLESLTGTNADMWMRLQYKYEQKLAAIEQAKARDREYRKLRRANMKPEMANASA